MQVRISHILIFASISQLLVGIFARVAPREEGNNADQYPQNTLGPEGSDPATTEYQIMHMALNVRNLTRSLEFYTQVFGMRLMVTTQITRHYSTSFLGYSSGGKNGTGYMTTQELVRHARNSQGILELISTDYPNSGITPSSTESTNTFSHVSFVVPDTEVVQARLESYNVIIYKRVGDTVPLEGPFSRAVNLHSSVIDPGELTALRRRLSGITNNYIFAADPDGNLLEIIPKQ